MPEAAASRLDIALVAGGMARSRNQAQQLIRSGLVSVNEAIVTKASAPVWPSDRLVLADETPTWVGRGARKLDAALTGWAPDGLEVAQRRCLDVGASTGGFTQVLLHHGAAQVIAVDVGHHQLAAELVADPRVLNRPGTHINDVTSADLEGPVDLAVIDLSFISLASVLPRIIGLVRPAGDIIALIKPQFEVGRAGLGKKGVVQSAELRGDAIGSVIDAAVGAGATVRALMASPVTGTHGNHEYLLWLRVSAPGMMGPSGDPAGNGRNTVSLDDVEARIAEVIARDPGEEPT